MDALKCSCLNQPGSFVNPFLKYANIRNSFRSVHCKIVPDIKLKPRIAGILEVNKTDDLWENEKEIIIYSVLAVTPSQKRDGFDLVYSH